MGRKVKKKGFTIIEIIIGMAIFGIILIPMANMVITSVTINKKAQDKQQGTLLAEKALEKVKFKDCETKGDVVNFLTSSDDLHMKNYDLITKKGYIYYKKDGTEGSDTSYDFKIEVSLDDTTAYNGSPIDGKEIVNGLEVSDVDKIKFYNDGNSSSPYSLDFDEITVVVKPGDSDYKYEVFYTKKVDHGTGKVTESYTYATVSGKQIKYNVSDKDIGAYLNYTVNINNDISDDKSLVINVENTTEKTLNLYINKNSKINANYMVNNKFGKVNQFFNSETQPKYSDIKNSVKINMRVYDSNGKELTNIEGVKNLSE
ncbi:MAG: prepilin-type N-terminal cleavage/methylation domain-containing protein [Clostridiaceae bacterium]